MKKRDKNERPQKTPLRLHGEVLRALEDEELEKASGGSSGGASDDGEVDPASPLPEGGTRR